MGKKIYAHYLDGKCFYVGCGTADRPYDFVHRNVNWKAISKGRKPLVVILDEKEDYLDALECEKYHISRMTEAGVILANKPAAKYWLGKKRDPELMRKMVELSHTPEAIAKARTTKANSGWSPSAEHRAAVSEKLTGRNLTENQKANISSAKKGRPNGLKGRVMPEEHRKAISEATKGRRPLTAEEQARRLATWRANGGTSSKAKAVMCLETGEVFRSAKDAAAAKSCSDKHIQACCVGRRKPHANMTWGYA